MTRHLIEPVLGHVSRETFHKAELLYQTHLTSYSRLIETWLKWNRSLNLFSRKTDAGQLQNHILHSLLLLFDLRSDNYELVLDAGTGGGLPGLPMAIADPERNYCLVDKVTKKQMALKNIIRPLSINNVQLLCEDIKNLKIDNNIRVVSKYAFHIPEILIALQHCKWVEISLLKGQDVFDELDENIIREYDIEIRKIENDTAFFINKYIVSILNRVN